MIDWNIREYTSPEDNIQFIVEFLKQGELSIILGAGASKLLKLPNWWELVGGCIKEHNKHCRAKGKIDDIINNRVTRKTKPDKLKSIIQKIKKRIDEKEYLDIIESKLYESTVFDFNSARKELLIALVTLILQTNNQGVDSILTYNFDCLLEWYLLLMGIDIDVITKDKPIRSKRSIKILHYHGYLPNNTLKNKGHKRTSVVFSKKEFEDMKHESWEDFWKFNLHFFLSTKVFLSVGLGPSSIEDDLLPVLRQIERNRKIRGVQNQSAYGFAIIPEEDIPDIDNLEEFKKNLLDDKVIPLFISIDEIPNYLLKISSQAAFT